MSALDRKLLTDLTVIVPAAGAGARAGGDRPKQYQLLGDDYLLDVTLDRLTASLPDSSVYVVLSPNDRWWQSSRSAAPVPGAVPGRSRSGRVCPP